MHEMIQISGTCKLCEQEKTEYFSVVFPTGHTVTMCMDCYAAAMKTIKEEDEDIHPAIRA
jgi:hypothetical protein